MVRGKAEICFLHIKSGGTLAASAQENIRRKKQILHRILRSGGLPYVSMPSPSRLGSAQNLRFSDANSFANMFYIKNSLILYVGEIFLDLIRLQKSHWQNRMFSYVEAALPHPASRDVAYLFSRPTECCGSKQSPL